MIFSHRHGRRPATALARLLARPGLWGGLLLPLSLQAGEPPTLPDPTQPDPPAAKSAPSLARGPWRISLLLVGAQRAVAIVNGQQVQPGDLLGPATVRAIDREGVTLTLEGEEIRLRQNVCFQIETHAQGRRLVHQEGLCAGEEPPPQAVIPLQRDENGQLWLMARFNDQVLRFRLKPEAPHSLIPEHAVFSEANSRVKRSGSLIQLPHLQLGPVTLQEVNLEQTKENHGVLGREILDRLGAWRLDNTNSRLLLEN